MPNYRRLISYIYAYEGGVKGKNIGFAKIEIRNGQCRIHVNVKRIFLGNSDIGVYLLSPQKEIMLGRIFVRNGTGEFRVNVNADDVENSGCSMEQCYGLTIHEMESTWRTYTTIWEDAVAQAAEVELANVTAQETGTLLKKQEEFSVSEEIRRELEAEDSRKNENVPWKEPEIVSGENPETEAGATAGGEAEKTTAETHAEGTVTESQAEGTAAESQAGGTAAESQAEGTVTESQAEGTVTESQAEGTVTESQAGGAAAESQAEGAAAESQAEGTTAESQAERATEEATAEGQINEEAKKEAQKEEYIEPKNIADSEKDKAVMPDNIEKTAARDNGGEESKNSPKEAPETEQSAEDGWKRGSLAEPLWRGGILPEESQGGSGRDSVQERVLKFAKVFLQGRVPADGESLSQGNITGEAAPANRASETPARQMPRPRTMPAPRPEPGDPARLAELDRLEREETARDNIWSQLQRRYAKVLAFDYADGCEILSIKPQDIGMLPRENWIYGNNSFLLHGYYNYRHLILARLENPGGEPRYLLGVPGHYFSNEKNLASMFGFPYFVLAKKQPEQDGRFGYWYTDLRL